MDRVSFDVLYLQMAFMIARRSVDCFTKVGCIATNKNNELIGGSYNGFPPGYEPKFDMLYHREEKNELIYHAEQNIILRHPRGEIHNLYLTHSCCATCAKLVAGHGVKNVIYAIPYHKEDTFKKVFAEYGVNCHNKPISEIADEYFPKTLM